MKSRIAVESSPAFSPVSASRPIEHIQKLIDAIEPFTESFTPLKGEAIRYLQNNKRFCYLLLEGSATLHRRGDGMILNSEKAPFLLGVSSLRAHHDHLYVRATPEAKMSRLPLERLHLLLQRENLWESLCYLIIYTASRVYENCTLNSQLSSYEIIKIQLNELMQEPERVRLNVTAANYIQNRTYLSRSGVMKILSHLRDAECITLNRGVLLSVNRLPQRY